MINKQTITALFLGAIIVAFGYHAYTVYQFKKLLNEHARIINTQGTQLKGVVDFLSQKPVVK